MATETVTLMSSDGEEFTVSVEAAKQATTIANAIEEAGTEEPIPCPNVSKAILEKIIEYCEYHRTADGSEDGSLAVPEDERRSWDEAYVRVEQATLFELILAANYLNVKPLLDLLCLTVANLIKGKTPDEIREQFHIENDFTPEEEEEVRRENQWAFE